ncbi:MAG: acyltransferase [Calditrichaceae bacterium]
MKQLNISQVDTIFANGSYTIEFLLYYKNKINTQKIKSALKKLSTDFWPIFGKYESGIIHFDTYVEGDCFEEDVINEDFNYDLSYREFYEKYNKAVPENLKKLFFLKVIQYKNGTILIPKMKHLAGDGYSYFYFLSVLAQITQSNTIPLKGWLIRLLARPNHNRTILKEFKLPNIELTQFKVAKNVTINDEFISKSDVRKMIREIADNADQKVSTNDILSAMVVKKMIEIQKDKVNDEYLLNMPIDVRRNIKEYGSKFFGNGLMFHQITFKTVEILKSDLSEIAIKIRQGMPKITTQYYEDYFQSLERIIDEKQTDHLRPYDPETGCLVTNLSRLPASRLNFGTGNPDLIFPLTIGKNAASVLADDKNFILRLVY